MLFRFMISVVTLCVSVAAMIAVVVSVNWVTQEAASMSRAANGMEMSKFTTTRENTHDPILSKAYLEGVKFTGKK